MLEGFDFWKLLAGLGIFMFGMFLLEESIRKLSGRAFKRLIRRSTSGKIKSIFSGLFVTSILQSSSAVSLMVLAFVGAGIMSMQNAIGVILGSNIGTTVTAWIVATVGFKVAIESFALPLIGIGGLGIIFLGRSERYSNISKLLVGFGFLFMGLDYMKVSVEVFTERFDLSAIPNYGTFLYLGIGIVLTAVMQSSSATMAIVLTTLNAGVITFPSAAAMVVGANVGTTITILLGSIGGVQVKKRVAYSHFVFNMLTAILAMALMPVLVYIALKVFGAEGDAVLALALFHTMFNVLGVAVFLPFIHLLAKLLTRLFPDEHSELTLFINNATTSVAEAAITAMKEETLHLVGNVLRYNLSVLNIDEKLIFTGAQKGSHDHNRASPVLGKQYENLKLLQAEIFTFSSEIQAQELAEEESTELNRCLHSARTALHSAKTLKDIRHDFDEFENADNTFLNDQYVQFRKRLILTYVTIDQVMQSDNGEEKIKAIMKLIHQLRSDDRNYLIQATKATKKRQITDLHISTAIIVNRAFIQSSRQVLLAIRELVLDEEEIKEFERALDINEAIMEQEGT